MRFPGRCPGLVCVAHSGPLTDEVGSVLDRAVYFPLAGYAGPGFQNWPGSADVLVGEYETGDSHPKKKAFGAATGVSDPRLQKIRIRNNGAGGQAAAVAGYGGPGFHTWPTGHILQTPDTNSLIRPRSFAKKSFGAATGVSASGYSREATLALSPAP